MKVIDHELTKLSIAQRCDRSGQRPNNYPVFAHDEYLPFELFVIVATTL